MNSDTVMLPFGVTMYTDEKPVVFTKPGCPDIEYNNFYSSHEIIGRRFVNVQYSYRKFKCSDETGEEWESALDMFCVDLLNFTEHEGYARKLADLYFIQDSYPDMLTVDDSLIIYPKLTSKKPLVFAPELPIMDDNDPFTKVADGIYCIKYLNFDGEFAWVILFSPSTGRSRKIRFWKTTNLNGLVNQFQKSLPLQDAIS